MFCDQYARLKVYSAYTIVGESDYYLSLSRPHDINTCIHMTHIPVFINTRLSAVSNDMKVPAYPIAFLLLTWRRGILWGHMLHQYRGQSSR